MLSIPRKYAGDIFAEAVSSHRKKLGELFFIRKAPPQKTANENRHSIVGDKTSSGQSLFSTRSIGIAEVFIVVTNDAISTNMNTKMQDTAPAINCIPLIVGNENPK